MTITQIKTARFYNLNLTAIEAMLTLATEGCADMTTLADQLQLTTVSVTNIADRLGKLGMVERVRSTTDRRAITLRLTEKGRSRIYQITGHHALDAVAAH